MSDKDLAKFGSGGVPANPSDLVEGLQRVNAGIQSSGGPMLLRLLKSGVYAYGQENIEPEPGSHWAINPYSIHHGYACWQESELLGEVMVPFNQMPPPVSELQDFGAAWNQQVAMQLMCMDGEDKGTQVMLKGTSVGLRNASKQIINDIIGQASNDPDHIVPVVELEVDSYHHKKWGEVFFPVLEVVEWISIENAEPAEQTPEDDTDASEDEALAAAGQPEDDEPQPRRRRRAAAAEKEPEKPARRRRRK